MRTGTGSAGTESAGAESARRRQAEAAGSVRAVSRDDLPAVADLFARTFRPGAGRAGPEAAAYLDRLFVAPLAREPEIASLVHCDPRGAVTGFLGVIAMPFVVDGAPRRAAICGSLMASERESDPFAGAKLLRAFLAGPQDVSLSETANAVSQGMWRRLRGTILPEYSLEWLRVFRPAAFALSFAGLRRPALLRAAPLARPLDALAGRLGAFGAPPEAQARVEPLADDAALGALLERFTAPCAARPDWAALDLHAMLADARRKSRFGAMKACVALRGEAPVGVFVYHAKPGGVGHVLQIAAAPGQTETVLDALFRHAWSEGLAGLRGRTQPALLASMLTRGCHFTHRAASLVHARDPAILARFVEGAAFFNGLAGESWTRLIGDDLA